MEEKRRFLQLYQLVVAGQKGIVEEKDLRIPNMRGIMMARKKPLAVVDSTRSCFNYVNSKFRKTC